jgi:hypothetical protein
MATGTRSAERDSVSSILFHWIKHPFVLLFNGVTQRLFSYKTNGIPTHRLNVYGHTREKGISHMSVIIKFCFFFIRLLQVTVPTRCIDINYTEFKL